MFDNLADPNRYISDFFNAAPKLSAMDSDQGLYALYETHFQLFNHINGAKIKSQPLALVAMHEGEDNGTTSSLYEQIDFFVKKEVYKHTGLSLTEFFNLPREIYTKVVLLVAEKDAAETKTVNQLQASFDKPQK